MRGDATTAEVGNSCLVLEVADEALCRVVDTVSANVDLESAVEALVAITVSRCQLQISWTVGGLGGEQKSGGKLKIYS